MGVMKYWQHDENEQKIATEALKVLEATASDLLQACYDAVSSSSDIFERVNSKRWFKKPNKEECVRVSKVHQESLDHLRRATAAFEVDAVEALMKPHAHLFDEDGILKLPKKGKGEKVAPVHGLYLGLNLKHRVVALAESLIILLEYLIHLEQERTLSKFRLPSKLTSIFTWTTSTTPVPGTQSTDPDDMDVKEEHDIEESKRREEKQQSYIYERAETNGRLGKKRKARWLIKILHWFSSSQGSWALRTVIVTFAMSIPAVLKSSSGFYYREKGII